MLISVPSISFVNLGTLKGPKCLVWCLLLSSYATALILMLLISLPTYLIYYPLSSSLSIFVSSSDSVPKRWRGRSTPLVGVLPHLPTPYCTLFAAADCWLSHLHKMNRLFLINKAPFLEEGAHFDGFSLEKHLTRE